MKSCRGLQLTNHSSFLNFDDGSSKVADHPMLTQIRRGFGGGSTKGVDHPMRYPNIRRGLHSVNTINTHAITTHCFIKNIFVSVIVDFWDRRHLHPLKGSPSHPSTQNHMNLLKGKLPARERRKISVENACSQYKMSVVICNPSVIIWNILLYCLILLNHLNMAIIYFYSNFLM